jgi:hypothetical protein
MLQLSGGAFVVTGDVDERDLARNTGLQHRPAPPADRARRLISLLGERAAVVSAISDPPID